MLPGLVLSVQPRVLPAVLPFCCLKWLLDPAVLMLPGLTLSVQRGSDLSPRPVAHACSLESLSYREPAPLRFRWPKTPHLKLSRPLVCDLPHTYYSASFGRHA